jgi:hypothetical protein
MKKLLAAILSIVAGITIGLVSAQTMMERASQRQDGSIGNWHSVRIATDSSSGFYAASSFLRNGQLPPPRGARFYTRNLDDEGNALRGGCVVSVEGKMPDLRWWSLKAQTTSAYASLDAGEALREPDGSLLISISRAPSAGNWLKVLDDGAYDLNLVIFDPAQPAKQAVPSLPAVKRLWC